MIEKDKLVELLFKERILLIMIFIVIPLLIGLIGAIIFSLTGYDPGGKIIVNQFVSDWVRLSAYVEIVILAICVAVALNGVNSEIT